MLKSAQPLGHCQASEEAKFEHLGFDRIVVANQGLERAHEKSTLPDMPSGRAELNELLARLRLNAG